MALLLTTKFFPPPAPAGFVARPQLLEELDEALTRRLTLVSAPAGAGKTVLVSAWVRAKRRSGAAAFVWLSLDEADNAPKRFWEYLVASLEEGGVDLESVHILPENGDSGAEMQVLLGMLGEWLNLSGELVVILDDYHVIQNPEIHAALGTLLEHPPSHLHLVLLTRSDPPLELARLRVLGQLTEIRMNQLRFSTQEAAIFLQKSVGVPLNESEVATLNTRAEGWIAGLQMAAISLRGRGNIGAFVIAFAGSHRFVYDYLMEQVLNRQSPAVREFLFKTSLLERFSASLCEAVVETSDARRFLDVLERDNLFLVPLDDERGWYRYHHLFSDLLKMMLVQSYPGLASHLHSRARAWYEAQSLIPEAINHALAAGEMEQAARLVSANVLTLLECDEAAPILKKLEAIPTIELQVHPWLAVAYAWLSVGHFQKALDLLALSEKTLPNLHKPERQRLMGHLAAARVNLYNAEGNIEETVHQAQLAEQWLPPEEIAVRALVLSTWGDILSKDHHDPDAMPILERALRLAREAGNPQVALNAGCALVLAHFGAGRLRIAEQICLDLLALLEDYQHRHQQTPMGAAICYTLLGRIVLEKGEPEAAIHWGRKSLALGERGASTQADPLSLQYLALALVFKGEMKQGVYLFQRSERVAQQISTWWWQVTAAFALDSFLDIEPLDGPHVQAQLRTIKACGAEIPPQVQVRLLIKAQRAQEALALIATTLDELGDQPSTVLVRLLIHRALAFQILGDEKAALAAFQAALEQAAPEGRIFPFVREGEPVEKMLCRAVLGTICPEFTRHLLNIFEARRKPLAIHSSEEILDPLSEREREILSLLDGPLSTPEIAEKLFVSANTVRTHVRNIYGKLGAHSRSGAVRRAQALGLLPSSHPI